MSWTSTPGILGDMTGAQEPLKQCEWMTRLAGKRLCFRTARCRFVADRGKRFCPRHEMENAVLSNRDDVQDAATGER